MRRVGRDSGHRPSAPRLRVTCPLGLEVHGKSLCPLHRKLDDAQSTPLRPFQTHQATDVQPLVPGAATKMRVEMFPFSQVVRAGRRLRLTIGL